MICKWYMVEQLEVHSHRNYIYVGEKDINMFKYKQLESNNACRCTFQACSYVMLSKRRPYTISFKNLKVHYVHVTNYILQNS